MGQPFTHIYLHKHLKIIVGILKGKGTNCAQVDVDPFYQFFSSILYVNCLKTHGSQCTRIYTMNKLVFISKNEIQIQETRLYIVSYSNFI